MIRGVGGSTEVNTTELISQRVWVRVTIFRFYGSSGRDFVGRGQHSSDRVSGIPTRTIHQSTTPSLTKLDIKTVPHPPYSPDVAPCDICLLPKLSGCRYETIEEMKEAVTKVIDTFTQEDFHGAFQKLLERYNKCIAAGDYFEGAKSFMCVLSIKVPIRKKSGHLFNDPRSHFQVF